MNNFKRMLFALTLGVFLALIGGGSNTGGFTSGDGTHTGGGFIDHGSGSSGG